MTTFAGTFEWIPAEQNGPTVPFDRSRMSAFAYVEPRWQEEGAVLLDDVPAPGSNAPVGGRWLPGYDVPETREGDTITVTASQRPIATITVTAVDERK